MLNDIDVQNYCIHKGITIEQIKTAVIIQKIIHGDISGSATITTTPTNNTTIEIQAMYGVSHTTTEGDKIQTDTYAVDRETFSIKDIHISTQTKKNNIDTKHGGVKTVQVPYMQQSIQKISNNNIVDLARITKKIHNHYHKGVHMQWALEDGELIIVQATPLLT